jgi:hypothetical protein
MNHKNYSILVLKIFGLLNLGLDSTRLVSSRLVLCSLEGIKEKGLNETYLRTKSNRVMKIVHKLNQ